MMNSSAACNSTDAVQDGFAWVGVDDERLGADDLYSFGRSTTSFCSDARSGEETFASLPAGWKTTLSLIPFVIVFQGILSCKLSSRYVAPFTLLVVILLGLTFFRDSPNFVGDALPEATGKVILQVLDRGFWTVFEYAFNVFTAFFFLRILQLWGIVDSMREDFEGLADNPTRKILLVAYCFAIALAVVAPGGSNFVIAGSILINMNLLNLRDNDPERIASNKRIGALALFGNALTSAFNLLGVCIVTIAEDISPLDTAGAQGKFKDDPAAHSVFGAKEIGRLFSMQFLILAMIAPLVMAYIFSGRKTVAEKVKDILPDVPICLGTGFVYAVVQLLVAAFVGPKLPCLLAGGAAMLFYIAIEKGCKKKPSQDDDKDNEADQDAAPRQSFCSKQSLAKRAYVLPFIMLVGLLLIIGVIPGVLQALNGEWGDDPKNHPARDVLNPALLDIQSGGVKYSRRFSWLSHSGIIVLIVGMLTPLVVPFRQHTTEVLTQTGISDTAFMASTITDKAKFKRVARKMVRKLHAIAQFQAPQESMWARRRRIIGLSLSEAIHDVLPVLFSITSFASIAKLMDKFSMTQSIANTIVSGLTGASGAYTLVMPVIGMLGSALTGSTTTSNFLFARLQVNTAARLGLLTGKNSVFEVGGLQILGATAGEIISPMNAVVITLMDGVGGTESALIRQLIPITLIWLVWCMLTSVIFMNVPGLD